ncbi:MAG TPA: NUDIX hydrolase [Lacipirellulaceae bacterium]|jgi:8-oxo-dGTP pyrophosphatase MutT (NUDIX family)|nr:NUDIX hydrolase [Lacipirellulaceae bacterium]
MSRWPLFESLSRYRDAFPDEAAVVDRISALVNSRPDCFERTCRPGHITAAAWILSADRRRVLLTHHRKLGRWLQLGGHSDGQWHVEEVALREAREESGLSHFELVPINGVIMPFDLDVHVIPARFDASGTLIEDAHEHHDIRFLLIATSDDEIQISDESHDVRWCTPDEVRELTDEESVLRMLYKALELIG